MPRSQTPPPPAPTGLLITQHESPWADIPARRQGEAQKYPRGAKSHFGGDLWWPGGRDCANPLQSLRPPKEKRPGSVTLPGRVEMWSREIYPVAHARAQNSGIFPIFIPEQQQIECFGVLVVFFGAGSPLQAPELARCPVGLGGTAIRAVIRDWGLDPIAVVEHLGHGISPTSSREIPKGWFGPRRAKHRTGCSIPMVPGLEGSPHPPRHGGTPGDVGFADPTAVPQISPCHGPALGWSCSTSFDPCPRARVGDNFPTPYQHPFSA